MEIEIETEIERYRDRDIPTYNVLHAYNLGEGKISSLSWNWKL